MGYGSNSDRASAHAHASIRSNSVLAANYDMPTAAGSGVSSGGLSSSLTLILVAGVILVALWVVLRRFLLQNSYKDGSSNNGKKVGQLDLQSPFALRSAGADSNANVHRPPTAAANASATTAAASASSPARAAPNAAAYAVALANAAPATPGPNNSNNAAFSFHGALIPRRGGNTPAETQRGAYTQSLSAYAPAAASYHKGAAVYMPAAASYHHQSVHVPLAPSYAAASRSYYSREGSECDGDAGERALAGRDGENGGNGRQGEQDEEEEEEEEHTDDEEAAFAAFRAKTRDALARAFSAAFPSAEPDLSFSRNSALGTSKGGASLLLSPGGLMLTPSLEQSHSLSLAAAPSAATGADASGSAASVTLAATAALNTERARHRVAALVAARAADAAAAALAAATSASANASVASVSASGLVPNRPKSPAVGGGRSPSVGPRSLTINAGSASVGAPIVPRSPSLTSSSLTLTSVARSPSTQARTLSLSLTPATVSASGSASANASAASASSSAGAHGNISAEVAAAVAAGAKRVAALRAQQATSEARDDVILEKISAERRRVALQAPQRSKTLAELAASERALKTATTKATQAAAEATAAAAKAASAGGAAAGGMTEAAADALLASLKAALALVAPAPMLFPTPAARAAAEALGLQTEIAAAESSEAGVAAAAAAVNKAIEAVNAAKDAAKAAAAVAAARAKAQAAADAEAAANKAKQSAATAAASATAAAAAAKPAAVKKPAGAAGSGSSSVAYTELQSFKEYEQRLAALAGLREQLAAEIPIKTQRELKREIKTQISKLAGTRISVDATAMGLSELLQSAATRGAGDIPPETAFKFAALFCCEQIITRDKDVDAEVFAKGQLLDTLCGRFPAMRPIAISVFNDRSIFTVPVLPRESEFKTLSAYKRRLGFTFDEENKCFEDDEVFFGTAQGVVRKYLAFLQVDNSQCGDAPVAELWTWVARLCNAPTTAASALLWVNFLQIAGFRFMQCFPRQSGKVIALLKSVVMDGLEPFKGRDAKISRDVVATDMSNIELALQKWTELNVVLPHSMRVLDQQQEGSKETLEITEDDRQQGQ